jgi:hypothetical protein
MAVEARVGSSGGARGLVRWRERAEGRAHLSDVNGGPAEASACMGGGGNPFIGAGEAEGVCGCRLKGRVRELSDTRGGRCAQHATGGRHDGGRGVRPGHWRARVRAGAHPQAARGVGSQMMASASGVWPSGERRGHRRLCAVWRRGRGQSATSSFEF